MKILKENFGEKSAMEWIVQNVQRMHEEKFGSRNYKTTITYFETDKKSAS